MADINTLLTKISTARYGRDVRQSIVDAIKQCYTDMQALNPDTTKILSELNKIKESMEEGDEGLQESIDKLNEYVEDLQGENTALYNSTVDLFDYCKRLNQAISASNEEIEQLSKVLDMAKVTTKISSTHVITGATDYAVQGIAVYGRAIRETDAVTPDSTSDIEVTDKVSIVISGKQLVNIGRISKTVNGIKITTADGVATIDGHAEVAAETLLLEKEVSLPAGSYYIASNCDDTRITVEIFKVEEGEITRYSNGSFTVSGNEDSLKLLIYADPTANSFFNNIIAKPMLNPGTSEELFEDCKLQVNSYEVSDSCFAGVPVTTGGNYIDDNGQEWISDTLTYDALGNVVYTKNVQRISVKENINSIDVSGVDSVSVFSIIGLPKPLAEGYGICNAIPVGTVAGSTIITTEDAWPDAICVTEDGTLNFFSSAFTTLSSLEAWLEDNDIVLYYPLAEPVVTEKALGDNESLLFMHSDYTVAYTEEGDMFNLTYIGQYNTLDEIVLNSCTEGSTKKFIVKIDDEQNIIITEL